MDHFGTKVMSIFQLLYISAKTSLSPCFPFKGTVIIIIVIINSACWNVTQCKVDQKYKKQMAAEHGIVILIGSTLHFFLPAEPINVGIRAHIILSFTYRLAHKNVFGLMGIIVYRLVKDLSLFLDTDCKMSLNSK